MITKEESEKKVFSEFLLVKNSAEKILGKTIKNEEFKRAIADVSKKIIVLARNKEDKDNTLVDDIKAFIEFFDNCKHLLRNTVWNEIQEKHLKIEISYESKAISSWKIPIEMMFSHPESFEVGMPTLIESFEDVFLYSCLDPSYRQRIMQGDDQAIKILYSVFQNNGTSSCSAIQLMIKENFPEFYDHITKKLDVMKFEEIPEESKAKKGRKRKQVKHK